MTRARTRARRDPDAPHNSETNAYYHCKCNECRAATRRRIYALRDRRRAARKWVNGHLVTTQPGVSHGKLSTYQNWGCRCPDCRAANRQHQRDRAARRREFVPIGDPPPRRPQEDAERRRNYVAGKVVEYVMANAHDPDLSVAGIAEVFEVDVHYLIATFKCAIGETPWQYVTKVRMREAQRLLARGDLPVSVIANYVGYATREGFATAFRRYSGVGPRAYRTRVRSAGTDGVKES